jgi:hypothetical protein
MLKIKDIELRAKPLGRPPALSIPVSPGERNPLEGKFGQSKTAYGLTVSKRGNKQEENHRLSSCSYFAQNISA